MDVFLAPNAWLQYIVGDMHLWSDNRCWQNDTYDGDSPGGKCQGEVKEGLLND